MPKGRKYPPDEVRFWARVQKTESCWLWTGKPRNGDGYGQMRVNTRKEYPHRFSYMIHKGPIPKGMVLCHTCDNPACVNPEHLWVGTVADNVLDMHRKGRANNGRKRPGKPVKRYGRVFKTHVQTGGRTPCGRKASGVTLANQGEGATCGYCSRHTEFLLAV